MNSPGGNNLWTIAEADEPLFATAVHDGHSIRPGMAENLVISEVDRLREEDPYSGPWTQVAGNRMVPRYSRFQVDLNRPREKAVYVHPEDAWGLKVWREPPAREVIDRSLAEYDAWYTSAGKIMTRLRDDFGGFVVLDLHTYNHRRAGAGSPPEDPAGNPEVNVGTASVDKSLWAPLVRRFMEDLRGFDFLGRSLDVRENVRFLGGNFPRWINATYPGSGCALAIEFKKFFMNEWTGEIHRDIYDTILPALATTIPGLKSSLERLRARR